MLENKYPSLGLEAKTEGAKVLRHTESFQRSGYGSRTKTPIKDKEELNLCGSAKTTTTTQIPAFVCYPVAQEVIVHSRSGNSPK
ncbi:hypothetical protein RHMOL_Rhmol02G0001000 [Rhododendron molle]|uniref:Uncharacterized protein n=1 Tax=Rhododendron molle TaxID=49168 RepID=A0ACC0PJN2_RHOML|nr:hypothetical protein RHMOL_Rhmol02G0001000 [Rhododendron molle]